MLRECQPLEPRRAVEGKIELVVVHHVQHEDVVPSLPQQSQAAQRRFDVAQQVRDDCHPCRVSG